MDVSGYSSTMRRAPNLPTNAANVRFGSHFPSMSRGGELNELHSPTVAPDYYHAGASAGPTDFGGHNFAATNGYLGGAAANMYDSAAMSNLVGRVAGFSPQMEKW